MTPSPTIHLVEDDPDVCEAIGWVLQDEHWNLVTFDRPSDVLVGLDESQPGCLVVDLSLPEMTGLELCDRLRRRGCQLPFIIISGHGRIPDAVAAIRKGAIDFIEKPLDFDILIDRVRSAVQSDYERRLEEGIWQDTQSRFATLTLRETEVLDQVVLGRSNRQIADSLSLAVKTIEAHRSNLTRKLNAKSIAELVRLTLEFNAVRQGQ